jgi:hypothetical protein
MSSEQQQQMLKGIIEQAKASGKEVCVCVCVDVGGRVDGVPSLPPRSSLLSPGITSSQPVSIQYSTRL